MSEKIPFYGGQALIEGVLMRGSKIAVATIKGYDGEIHIHQENLGAIYQSNIKTLPFLRGIIALWDALVLGTRFLTISANHQTDKPEEQMTGKSLYLTLAFSVGIGILIFFVAPASLSQLFENMLGINPWVGNLVEGLIRILILIGYLAIIQQIPDVKRVFMYHGAEHKTINAFEADAELTPQSVSEFSLVHPRCGTSFILTVVVFSIIIFSLLGPQTLYWRIFSRLVFVIPIVSISYEYIRLLSSHLSNPIVSFIIKPNLWLQHLTTSEPTLDMIDIAITSLKEVIKNEALINA
jgi:uncharacterized protein YqhQ